MNGRLYDPELGRMLSPDPYVQVPEYSQNFNRYSYVLNNPLNLTDPTGFSWVGKLFGGGAWNWMRKNWRTVLVIAMGFALSLCIPGIGILLLGSTLAETTAVGVGTLAVSWGTIAAGAAIGAITGGLNAALNGGNLSDVLRGAVVGGVSGALTAGMHSVGGSLAGEAANVVGHGVIGGSTNVALGGKFGDGFLSAAASAATAVTGLTDPNTSSFNMAGRTAIASITGGTASALGGGKFSNGAITAAMSHLLNAEAPKPKKAFLIEHEQSARPSDVPLKYRAPGWTPIVDEGLEGMLESAKRAGYEVMENATLETSNKLWESRAYSEIVYYHHGSGNGLWYSYKINNVFVQTSKSLTQIFNPQKGFAPKVVVVCCQYNTVVTPHINNYNKVGISLSALKISQAPSGEIYRDDARQGLTNYFNGQKK